ncbi:hypothetical protein LCP963914a_9876 [Penicillium roqueforti]|nr:hypothetical protein LCP963914a_9876 [Penicillium roqueforti]
MLRKEGEEKAKLETQMQYLIYCLQAAEQRALGLEERVNALEVEVASRNNSRFGHEFGNNSACFGARQKFVSTYEDPFSRQSAPHTVPLRLMERALQQDMSYRLVAQFAVTPCRLSSVDASEIGAQSDSSCAQLHQD